MGGKVELLVELAFLENTSICFGSVVSVCVHLTSGVVQHVGKANNLCTKHTKTQ